MRLHRFTFIALLITISGLVPSLRAMAQAASGQSGGAAHAAQSYLLVISKPGDSLLIIDPATLKTLARVPTGEGPHEVIATADGKTAFVANYGTAQKPGASLSMIDLIAKKEVKRIELNELVRPHGLAEAGGGIYFTAEGAQSVARYNASANRVDWQAKTGQKGTHMLAISPDRKRIYTTNIGSDSVSVIELSGSNQANAAARVTQIAVGKQPEGIALSPDGRELWIGHRVEGLVSIIDTATNKVTGTLNVGEVPLRMTFTPDGKRILIMNPTGDGLHVIERATRREVKRIEIKGAPVNAVCSPDGRRAYVTVMQASKVVAVDLEKLEIVAEEAYENVSDGIAWAGK
jgi:YVTN family beta-propeller protein